MVPVRLHAGAGWGRPAVDRSTVYYLSKHHQLSAVDRPTHALRWTQRLNDAPGVTAGTTVGLAGDVVVAGDTDVFAFDRRSGRPRWRFVSGYDDSPGQFMAAPGGQLVVSGSGSGRLYALDAATGALRWRTPPLGEHVTVFVPVLDDPDVIAPFTDFGAAPRVGGVASFHGRSGALRWLVRFPPLDATRPVGAGGGVVATRREVFAAASDGTVYAFDRETGRRRRRWPPAPCSRGGGDPASSADAPAHERPADAVDDFRALAVRGDTLLVSSLSGVLCAIGLADGRVRWQYASVLDGSIAFGMSLGARHLYLPYASGRLIAVRVDDGREQWRIGGPGHRFEWPPARGGGRLYASGEDGLYELDDQVR